MADRKKTLEELFAAVPPLDEKLLADAPCLRAILQPRDHVWDEFAQSVFGNGWR